MFVAVDFNKVGAAPVAMYVAVNFNKVGSRVRQVRCS